MSHDAASNQAFRESFRQSIPPRYSGLRHAAVVLLCYAVVAAGCLAAMTFPLAWYEWALIVPVVLTWNVLEWVGHRALHRPGTTKLSKALYTRHTLTHHRFFTQEFPTLRDTRDLKIVFFPEFALPAITLLAAVPAAIAWAVISLNAALVVLLTVASLYLLFEVFHLCAHLPERAWVTRLPVISTMRRHHLAHHDPSLMMSTNMNFTLPWSDWYFKTIDIERGFFGTTFNGASTVHVRPRVRPDAAPHAAAPKAPVAAPDDDKLGWRADPHWPG